MSQTNEEILEEFYNEYFRAPEIKEFEGWGGDLYDVKKKYRSYKRFLQHFGLELQSKAETYEVVRIRNDEVKFVGTMTDIAFEYDTTRQAIRRNYKNGSVFRKEYKIKHKPYMPKEMVKKVDIKKLDPKKQKELDKAVEEARDLLDCYKITLKDIIRHSWVDNDGEFIIGSKYNESELTFFRNKLAEKLQKIKEIKKNG